MIEYNIVWYSVTSYGMYILYNESNNGTAPCSTSPGTLPSTITISNECIIIISSSSSSPCSTSPDTPPSSTDDNTNNSSTYIHIYIYICIYVSTYL